MRLTRVEHARPLTPGECALAGGVFGSDLDFAPVTLRKGKWFPFQPRRVVMAPDGHVWFHPQGTEWRDDFSVASLGSRALLVHELVHVWQRQQGVNLVLRRHPFARYAYTLVPGKPFAAYGIEQQACIVQDAFLLSEGANVARADAAAAYAVLIPFGTALRTAALTGSRNTRSPVTS